MTEEEQALDLNSAQEFADQIMLKSGQPLTCCYQCRKCAAGCPVGKETNYLTPDRLIRMIVLGDKKGALNNALVWRCVTCFICGTRCPNNIHTSRVTEVLKDMALEDNCEPLNPKGLFFHQAFLKSSLWWGRMNEIIFMPLFELKTIFYQLRKQKWSEIWSETKEKLAFGRSMVKLKRIHLGLTSSKGRKELKKLAAYSEKRNIDK